MGRWVWEQVGRGHWVPVGRWGRRAEVSEVWAYRRNRYAWTARLDAGHILSGEADYLEEAMREAEEALDG